MKQLFKYLSVIYLALVVLLFVKPDKGYGQDAVLIGNISLAGSPVASGSEPLYLGTNEIGCLFTTGSTATNLNSFKIKLWNSQGTTLSSFTLRIREVHANPVANLGDPVTYNLTTKYSNTVSSLIVNNLSALESNSNQFAIFPAVVLLANTSYIITLQNSTTQSVYWLQSDTSLPVWTYK